MPFLLLSGLLLLVAQAFIGSVAAVWVLAASQLALLAGQIRKGQVSGVGGFIFMAFLFFSVRPIYMILEADYNLLIKTFYVRTDMAQIGSAMWWASAGMLCFAVGAYMAPRINRRWLSRRKVKASQSARRSLVDTRVCFGMMLFQLLTLPIMAVLSGMGRSLYRTGFGAYIYDLPVPLQAVHIITVVVLMERMIRSRSLSSAVMLFGSCVLFLAFTWLMRDVTLFRGFYVAGVMIVGIAALQRLKGRVGYLWLILPVVLLQPFFQYLGGTRALANEKLAKQEIVDSVFQDQTFGEAYWNFYRSNGDMNIFDTFIAATNAEPQWHPYAWSWLYVPLHLIPRMLWEGKPKNGTTQDFSYGRGAPYSPGIVGFFVLDGGLFWMLGCMALLGFLVASLDGWVFTMSQGYLQYCLIGVVTVNAMFLTRFFLWQYFYQMLYAMLPIALLSWLFGRSARISEVSARNQKRSMSVSRSQGAS